MDDRQDLQNQLETRLIASLLRTPEWTGEAAALLRPEDFEGSDAADIFAALCRLFLDGRPITSVTAAVEAGDGYAQILRQLTEADAGTEDQREFSSLCDALQERSRLRRVSSLAFSLAQTQEPELAAHLVDEINGAMSRRRETRAVSMGQAAVEFITGLEETPRYLPWGIKRLDEGLEVEAGDFVVLGGYASSGKTLLALQMARTLAEDRRVGFFSLETSPGKLFNRLIAREAGVSLKRIKRRTLRDEDHAALTAAAITLEKLSLDLISAGGMSVSDVQAVTLQKRFEVIFVDYLQLMDAPGRERYEKVTAISIGLHTLAQRHGVTVVALAQLSRPERTKTRDGRPVPPSMNSFRESGQIEQDADVAMLLYPSDPDDNNASRILKISKNKEGEKFSLELSFDGATQSLVPAPEGKAIQRKLVNDGRRARQQHQQTAIAGFTDITETDKEALPF